MSIDVLRARAETPGCTDVVHLNNAGASLPPKVVTDAVIGYLQREALGGGYEIHNSEREAVDRYRDALATMINAKPAEVACVQNDTFGWAAAFWGLVHTNAIGRGSTVLVDRTSYVSHYLGLLQAGKHFGIQIVVADADETGTVDLGSLAALLDERVSMVALTHIGTHRGLVNPVAEAGALVRRNSNAFYLVDSCQALGHLPLDVRAIGCDVLTATGRKYLRAPRGTGLLFVSERIIEQVDPPGIDGSGASWIDGSNYELLPDARRFEPFESSMAAKVGLGVAADYALEWGIDAISERVLRLGEHLRTLLAAVDGVDVLDGGRVRSGIVTFREARRTPPDTQAMLLAAGINTSVARAESARLDMTQRGVETAVRASVHYYNTDDELERLASALDA